LEGEKEKPGKKGIAGLVFTGFLMIGMAIGFLTGNMVVGLFGGMGIGFLAMAIVRYKTGEW